MSIQKHLKIEKFTLFLFSESILQTELNLNYL